MNDDFTEECMRRQLGFPYNWSAMEILVLSHLGPTHNADFTHSNPGHVAT